MGRHSVDARLIPVPGGHPPVRVGPPTFSGTRDVQVAPGVRWRVPQGWDLYRLTNGAPNGLYVVEPQGRIHCLRANEHGQVEEVDLPTPLLPTIRRHLGIPEGAQS